MADLADVYASTQETIVSLVEGLSEDELERRVPATPEWRVRDVVAHLVGDLDCVMRGDFPREFFESFGTEAAVVTLNEWTNGQVEARRSRSVGELIHEWNALVAKVSPVLRGDEPLPEGVFPFADRVLITDIGVHQHDIYGAFGLERARDSAPVKIGSSGYLVTVDLRLRNDGAGTMAVETPDKRWVVGGEQPDATVRVDRFELFRALSGRRSPEQIAAYDWDGDPQPFIPYFYPYGVRREALHE